MKKRGKDTSKEISTAVFVITIILAIILSLIVSFMTLNFSANGAKSIDAGKITVNIVPTTGIQEGKIIVQIENKQASIDNGK